MKRENGFYWTVFMPELNDPEWMPGHYFEGRWFILGVCSPVDEAYVMVGPRIEQSAPPPSAAELQSYRLRNVASMGTA